MKKTITFNLKDVEFSMTANIVPGDDESLPDYDHIYSLKANGDLWPIFSDPKCMNDLLDKIFSAADQALE